MMYYLSKLGLSALVIVLVSETAKRSSAFGGLIASLPIVSLLAIIWLYHDTKDIRLVSNLSYSIFWMVIPSLVFFIALPELLKRNIPFYGALILASLLTIGAYFLMGVLASKSGLKF